MRTVKNIALGATVLVLAFGAFSPPAGAAPVADTLFFQGTMTTSPLYFASGIQPDGTWSFSSATGVCITALEGTCLIDAAGELTHTEPDGILQGEPKGPSCIASRAINGVGELLVDGLAEPATYYELTNVGWSTVPVVSDFGSLVVIVFPITADVVDTSTGETGRLTGLIETHYSATLDCGAEYGLSNFSILGHISIVMDG